ncbi:MAG: SIR2 family protein [Paenibacillaceae bacterium]
MNRLPAEQKALVEHYISDNNDRGDFERCIAHVEKLHDVLHYYQDLLRDDKHGKRYGEVNNLDSTALEKHVKSIRDSNYKFSALIVETIHGYVKHSLIDSKLQGFVKWFTSILNGTNEVDLFTLNYDLLLETILLQIGKGKEFMDFIIKLGHGLQQLLGNNPRYYFNPGNRKVMKKAEDCNTRLYHLHGSLSSFKDLNKESMGKGKGTYFKISTEAIQENRFFDKIFDLNIVPSIIAGDRKDDKIQEMPFRFYYEEFMKKMSMEDQLCDKLFIIGYSFRDDHINRMISERLKLSTQIINPRPLEFLTIVDFATSAEDKAKFIKRINFVLGLEQGAIGRFIENDSRILFGGANSIQVNV